MRRSPGTPTFRSKASGCRTICASSRRCRSRPMSSCSMPRANPFAKEGQPLAGGLVLVEPDPKMLIAFNAAPGTVAPESQPPYGPYAQALAEMIRAGGLSLPEVFDRVRLRVNEMTKG